MAGRYNAVARKRFARLADEFSHGTIVRPFPGLKPYLNAGPVPFRLVLTCFQLAGQGLNGDFHPDDSLYQTFGEIRWRIINGPGSAVPKHVRPELPLISHDIEDENPLVILTIKNAARWNHHLPVYRIR